jgi:aryl-alcohol dehydrogenase-like predicted oxidoreductase
LHQAALRQLLAKVITRRPNQAEPCLARRHINGPPDYVRTSIGASLKRLNTDYLDLYY